MPKAAAKPASARTGVPTPTSEVLTLAEAAAFLRVPEEGLRADAVAGRVPGRQVTGEWRFVKATLLAWLSPMPNLDYPKPGILSAFGAWKDFGEDPEQTIAELSRGRKG